MKSIGIVLLGLFISTLSCFSSKIEHEATNLDEALGEVNQYRNRFGWGPYSKEELRINLLVGIEELSEKIDDPARRKGLVSLARAIQHDLKFAVPVAIQLNIVKEIVLFFEEEPQAIIATSEGVSIKVVIYDNLDKYQEGDKIDWISFVLFSIPGKSE